MVDQGKIFNFIVPKVEIKDTLDKGRGVFATENIVEGELVLVEKATAFGFKGSQT